MVENTYILVKQSRFCAFYRKVFMENPVDPKQKYIGAKILSSLFRILTPDEIDFLCQMTDGMPKVSLTALVEKELLHKSQIDQGFLGARVESKAKILPFKSPPLLKTQLEAKAGTTIITQDSTPEVVVLEPEAKLEGAELIFKKDQIIIEKKIDRVKFVLEQRDRFRQHYINLKKNEIYDLYNKEAEVTISSEQEENVGQKANLVTQNKGILVDKKCS